MVIRPPLAELVGLAGDLAAGSSLGLLPSEQGRGVATFGPTSEGSTWAPSSLQVPDFEED